MRLCVCLCVTWTTEMNMLIFIISTPSQTPGVIGQGKQVFQPGRWSYGPVQSLDPLLTLLERCKTASVKWKYETIISKITKQKFWVRDPEMSYLKKFSSLSCLPGLITQMLANEALQAQLLLSVEAQQDLISTDVREMTEMRILAWSEMNVGLCLSSVFPKQVQSCLVVIIFMPSVWS